MARIEWSHEAGILAPPEAVFAWMSDLTRDDHESPAFRRGAGIPPDAPRGSERRILSREGDIVQVEDTWGRRTMRFAVRFDDASRRVQITGPYGYSATWEAAPHAEGTRLVLRGRMEPSGIVGLLMGLFRGRFLREMAADFAGHVEDLREATRAPAAAKP